MGTQILGIPLFKATLPIVTMVEHSLLGLE